MTPGGVGQALAAGAPAAAKVVTAGAFVLVDGRLPFMVGPTAAGDRLGVVRLGGHLEPGEAPWACAAREVREEASLVAQPVAAPATYWASPPHDPAALSPGPWPAPPGEPVAPLLVSWRQEGAHRLHSVVYLARAHGPASPGAEAAGLLLLRRRDVLALAREPVTLGAFLSSGGAGVFRCPLPEGLLLEPLFQLRALASLLARAPGLLPDLR